MKKILFIVGFVSALLIGIGGYSQDTATIRLQNETKTYLKQIKYNIQHNTPIPILADSDRKEWVDKGYENALKLVSRVKNENDQFNVLAYYTGGFHDSHTAIYQNSNNQKFITPGFAVIKENGRLYVQNVNRNIKEIKNGDEVIRCDGLPILEYFRKYFYDYTQSSPPPATWYVESMFVKTGNSFVRYPESCTFRDKEGKAYRVKLLWNGRYSDVKGSSLKFSQDVQKDGSIWLSIPTFRPDTHDQFEAALKILKENLKSNYIVFDLRGNGGGSTENAFPLIEAVYRTKYLKSLGNSLVLNRKTKYAWRATKSNIDKYLKYYSNRSPSLKPIFEPIIKKLEESLKMGKKLSYITEPLYSYKGLKGMCKPYPTVFYITDASIGSSCWQFVRVLKQLPGTYQIGGITDTEQNPTEMRQYSIGKNYTLEAPCSWIIEPQDFLGKVFNPDVPYTENLYNTEKLKEFVSNYYSLIK